MTYLTEKEAASAVDYNIRKARTVGWLDRWPQLAELLSLPPVSGGGETFARAVAKWQAANGPMTVDGKLGPATWRKMKPATEMSVTARPLPAWLGGVPHASPVRPAAPVPTGDAPWMAIAATEMRESWRNGSSRIREAETDTDKDYFAATPFFGGETQKRGERPTTPNADWCAAFVNYCLHTAGYSHTGSGGAVSFVSRNWCFEPLDAPRRGCVVVVSDGGGHHVAFLDRWEDLPDGPDGDVDNRASRNVYLLGGNQSDTVCAKRMTRNLIAHRTRTNGQGRRSPYLWPVQGPATCNCDLPTARPHHCCVTWK